MSQQTTPQEQELCQRFAEAMAKKVKYSHFMKALSQSDRQIVHDYEDELEKAGLVATAFRFCSKECISKHSPSFGYGYGYEKNGEPSCHGSDCDQPAILYDLDFVTMDYNRGGFDVNPTTRCGSCDAKPKLLKINGLDYMQNEGDGWLAWSDVYGMPICPSCREGNGRLPEGSDEYY
tara:strand:+ start:2545 stop:3075 length:531 start_codon:yes stop_codon:yes gene_type:complete